MVEVVAVVHTYIIYIILYVMFVGNNSYIRFCWSKFYCLYAPDDGN